MKTVKMSTRKGNFILLDDVLSRAIGEVILRQIEQNEERRDIWVGMIGSFFHSLEKAREQGEHVVTFHIDDFLEET